MKKKYLLIFYITLAISLTFTILDRIYHSWLYLILAILVFLVCLLFLFLFSSASSKYKKELEEYRELANQKINDPKTIFDYILIDFNDLTLYNSFKEYNIKSNYLSLDDKESLVIIIKFKSKDILVLKEDSYNIKNKDYPYIDSLDTNIIYNDIKNKL